MFVNVNGYINARKVNQGLMIAGDVFSQNCIASPSRSKGSSGAQDKCLSLLPTESCEHLTISAQEALKILEDKYS